MYCASVFLQHATRVGRPMHYHLYKRKKNIYCYLALITCSSFVSRPVSRDGITAFRGTLALSDRRASNSAPQTNINIIISPPQIWKNRTAASSINPAITLRCRVDGMQAGDEGELLKEGVDYRAGGNFRIYLFIYLNSFQD